MCEIRVRNLSVRPIHFNKNKIMVWVFLLKNFKRVSSIGFINTYDNNFTDYFFDTHITSDPYEYLLLFFTVYNCCTEKPCLAAQCTDWRYGFEASKFLQVLKQCWLQLSESSLLRIQELRRIHLTVLKSAQPPLHTLKALTFIALPYAAVPPLHLLLQHNFAFTSFCLADFCILLLLFLLFYFASQLAFVRLLLLTFLCICSSCCCCCYCCYYSCAPPDFFTDIQRISRIFGILHIPTRSADSSVARPSVWRI